MSAMRIQGPFGAGAVATAPAARRSASATFSLEEGDAPRSAGGTGGLRTVGGIDALIALQGIGDPTERRRQAIKRGRLALDALDELKLGLLGGLLSPAILTKLRSAAAFLKDASGDANLDSVLGEIELRVEVEVAKMSRR